MKLGQLASSAYAHMQHGAQVAKEYCLDGDTRASSSATPLARYRYDGNNSSLHNDMNWAGSIPVLGFFTGAARTGYGAVKATLGVVGTVLTGAVVAVASVVAVVADKVFNKRFPEKSLIIKIARICFNGCLASTCFAADGFKHTFRGIAEVGTLGCHRVAIKAFIKSRDNKAVISSTSSSRLVSTLEKKFTYIQHIRAEIGQERLAASALVGEEE